MSKGCLEEGEDQVFVVRQLCVKTFSKKLGCVFGWTFMDLEKAYDRMDRQGLWTVLGLYGGRLLKGVQSSI